MTIIETVNESDLPEIKNLLAELTEAMTDTGGMDIEQSIINYRELLKDPNHYLLLSKREDSIFAFINFTTRKTLMHPELSGLIDELAVSKDVRGLKLERH